ncbi:basic phospholipase A2 3-like [Physella acuta]|uniref:basic phospholipase A2 3-like n=1 Tax=Physella acuta TaxID=109671 RepID=UPI0027DD5512|nr:basic phospholipase A2 3-like [Physella acuta]
MTFSLQLIVLLLVVYTTGEQIDAPIMEGASNEEINTNKRSALNLGMMLSSMTKLSLLGTLINYNGYGCYCGLGGSGTPVDDVDKCCQIHDQCYGNITYCFPHVSNYDFSCSGTTCTCGQNTICGKKSCQCDLDFSKCVASKKYNPAYKSYDKKNKC